MKTTRVINEMAFLVIKKIYFPSIDNKMTTKTHFFRNNLENSYHLTGKYFENLNHFSFVASAEKRKLSSFVKILALKKIEQLNCCCPHLFGKWAEYQNYVLQNWGTSEKFERKLKKSNLTLSFWICQKQHCLALNQRKTDQNSSEQSWLLFPERVRSKVSWRKNGWKKVLVFFEKE